MLQLHLIPKFHPVLLYGQLFWVTGLWRKGMEWPKITLNSKKSNIRNMCGISATESQISQATFVEDCHREYSEHVWLKKNHKCRRSAVLKFSLP